MTETSTAKGKQSHLQSAADKLALLGDKIKTEGEFMPLCSMYWCCIGPLKLCKNNVHTLLTCWASAKRITKSWIRMCGLTMRDCLVYVTVRKMKIC